MKVIIVGGVAGGASCAARLRRLDESAEIVLLERGPYVSYANCGLPYHIGDVIERESALLVANEQLFRTQFGVDCRTLTEVVGVSAADRTVQLRDVTTGEVSEESYDALVLSPGGGHGAPADPGDRPAGDLRGPHGARCAGDPGVDVARDQLPDAGWTCTRGSRR